MPEEWIATLIGVLLALVMLFGGRFFAPRRAHTRDSPRPRPPEPPRPDTSHLDVEADAGDVANRETENQVEQALDEGSGLADLVNRRRR